MPVQPIPGGPAFRQHPGRGYAAALLDDIAFMVAPLTAAEWKALDERLSQRFSGFFVSTLMGAALPWRNLRHLAALSLFELDPAIDSIEVMPERVVLSAGGRPREYVPHFRLRSGSQVTMADVIRRDQEDNPVRARATALLQEIYARRGIRYCALPETVVTAQPRLDNARAILGCRGFRPTPDAEMAIVETLGQPGRHTVASLAGRLPTVAHLKDTVFALATRRVLRVDLGAACHGDMAVGLLSWKGLQ